MNINDFFVTDENNSQSFKLDGTNILGDASGSSKNKVNANDKFVLVLDCDDLLVDISNKWVSKIKAHPEMSQYFNDETPLVELREKYYLNNWLNIKDEHLEEFHSMYFNDATFYDDLVPSPIMESILLILDYVEEIHILTSCGNSLAAPATHSKLQWLKKHFGKSLKGYEDKIEFKIHIINTAYKDGKGGFLRDTGIKFNTFADDSLENIYSVINNVKHVNSYELLVPIYGFNHTLDPTRVSTDASYVVQGAHNIHNITSTDFAEMLQKLVTDSEESA